MTMLDGKVALITGAGGGLGRAYALLFSREGARVVVNDLGSDRHGVGSGTSLADAVVAEIQDAGGEAVAHYGSVADVADAQAMVDQAVQTFGRLDIVVNNAGILRDKTLVKMTDEMWDAVCDVHLKGTFLVTRAAVIKMRELGRGGRIINTSSISGLKGNFGQSNYGAAKAGIAGFTRVVALEGKRDGITANCIAPTAVTRMTEELGVVPEKMTPASIAPLVAWLASDEASEVTGRVFGAHGGHYFEYHQVMSPGVERNNWTVAAVGEHLEEIGALDRPPAAEATDSVGVGGDDGTVTTNETAERVAESISRLDELFVPAKAEGWAATLNVKIGDLTHHVVVANDTVVAGEGLSDQPTCTITFDGAETFLQIVADEIGVEHAFIAGRVRADNMADLVRFAQCFAMERAAVVAAARRRAGVSPRAVGGLNRACIGRKYKGSAEFVRPADVLAYAEATNDHNPRYHPGADNALVPPMFSVRPFILVAGQAVIDPDLGADVLRLVHGEQDMRFHQPLRPMDLVAARAEIVGIHDKRTGQLLEVRQWLVRNGEIVCEATSGFFIRHAGGRRNQRPSTDEIGPGPEIVFETTHPVAEDQPLRYAAVSLDNNPIHTDEKVAQAAGHPSIILHGLCTMAFASQAIIDGVCKGNPTRLARICVRFSKPVFPGTELTTRVWKEAEHDHYTVYGLLTTDQDGDEVLKNAFAEVVRETSAS